MRKLSFRSLKGLAVNAALLALAALPASAQISPQSLGPSMQGVPVSVTFSTPNIPGICYNWSLAGNPPPGLSLIGTVATPSTVYQGIPITSDINPYQFRITAVATTCPGGLPPNPVTFDQSLSHLIFPALDISPLTAKSGTVGFSYSELFSQVGGAGNGSIELQSGAIPPGLSWNFPPAAAILSGSPTAPGSYNFTLSVTDLLGNRSSRSYTVVIAAANSPLTFVTGAVLPDALAGTRYSVTLQTAGGIPPVAGLTGQNPPMPPGLFFDNLKLTISGTPTAPGNYSIPVTAVDAQGNTTSRTFTLLVGGGFRIITLSVPKGVVGQFYYAQIQTQGGTPPITFNFVGNLPPGLAGDTTTGVISGIPTTAGDFQFSVTATSGSTVSPRVAYSVSIALPSLDFTPEVLPNGNVGRAYRAEFRPIGGNDQYQFSRAQGTTLPPGLTLSAAGVVSGTPTTEGSFRFVVSLVSGDENIEKIVRITIDPPPLAIAPETLPEGTRGIPYQTALSATGGTSPYTFRVTSGQLPAGILLSASGALSGTPSAAGTSKFTVQTTDAGGRTGTRDYELIVREELRITTDSLPSGTQGEAYSSLVEATGGNAPYTFTVAVGSLPPGLSLASDGRLTGIPTQSGQSTVTIQAADRSNRTARREFVITIGAALRLLPDSLPAGTVGRAYSASFTAEGGQAPYTFAITGSLPSGIVFTNGVFSGTPSQSGQFSITGQVTDARNRTANRQYAIDIAAPPALNVSGTPGAGTVGTAYQAQFTATGGTAPITFSGSDLPAGLTLASNGVLSGTPTQAGTFNFTVTATDSFNARGSSSYQITISLPPLPPPTINIPSTDPGPNAQVPLTLTLAAPYPVSVTGVVELTFAPIRGADDPAIMFSNGSRRINFSIPAETTSAVFIPPQAAIQTGTVAGTITLLTSLQAGGVDITPSPRPSSTVRIAPGPPVITRVEVNRTATGSDLIVFCYTTAREVTQGALRLTARTGVTLSQSDFTIPLSTVFTTWYTSDQSAPFGSQARLVIPLTNVNTEAVSSLTIQLTNSIGSSEVVRFSY